MKAVVAAFNQEKALVGAFSVITNLRMELFQALLVSCSALPVVLTGGWVAAMAAGHSGGCWDDYSASTTIYIIVIPMTLTLSVTA